MIVMHKNSAFLIKLETKGLLSTKKILKLSKIQIIWAKKKLSIKIRKLFYNLHCTDYAGWIASTGQTSAHVPQSVQTSGLIL